MIHRKLALHASVACAVLGASAVVLGTFGWSAASGMEASEGEVFEPYTFQEKPSADEALDILKSGNRNFIAGKLVHPHSDITRIRLAGRENQVDHAFATVLTCSDSRVPVELIFDAGIMDLCVVRVAGNVCDTDGIGSIEYSLRHVNTPVLVVLGHTQCGVVTAVTRAVQGRGRRLEPNILALVDNIQPAVDYAIQSYPKLTGDRVIPAAIEENVWQGIRDLLTHSPATRERVNSGRVKVVGAIYDVGTGLVNWLPQAEVGSILKQVESDPRRAVAVASVDAR